MPQSSLSRSQTNFLHKSVSALADDKTLSETQEAMVLRSSNDVPDHHFFSLEMVGIEDWDLARFSVYNLLT